MDKIEKYQDEIKLYPKNKYPRNDGIITIPKTIRLSPEEVENWNPKLIHEFLQNSSPGENNDTEILKKMIPAFIKYGIEIELDTNEIERVKELHAEI